MALPWLLVCATRSEWGELKKSIQFVKDQAVSAHPFYHGTFKDTPVLLSQMGIGPKRAAEHAQFVLQNLRGKISGVIHFGLSGALVAGLKTADLILAQQIINEKNEVAKSDSQLFNHALEILQKNNIPHQTSNLFTSSTVLETPEHKKEMAEKFKAHMVDMESYPYAKACELANLPYLAIRAIWDPIDWDLSAFKSPIKLNGDINIIGITESLVKSPKLLLSLPQYQSATAKASKILAKTLCSLISL